MGVYGWRRNQMRNSRRRALAPTLHGLSDTPSTQVSLTHLDRTPNAPASQVPQIRKPPRTHNENALVREQSSHHLNGDVGPIVFVHVPAV